MFMFRFKPSKFSETIGLGSGMASAYGHSLLLDGMVSAPDSEKPFCPGQVRIEKRKSDSDLEIGLFEIRNIGEEFFVTAVLFCSDSELLGIRDLLLQSSTNIRFGIEYADTATLQDFSREKPRAIKITSASISGGYKTAFFQHKESS